MNVAETICRWATTHPDRPALIEAPSGRVVDFGTLDERTGALAAGFVAAGAAPGDRIAILAKNCNEYIEIYLACAKAGCVAHGLNWRFATPTMIEALRDSGPVMVCVQDEFEPVAEELRRELDIPDWIGFGADSADGSYEDLIAAHRGESVGYLADGDDPFTIMYTGGTTGDSKGALHSHATVGAAMANNTIAERIVPTDRYMLLGQAFHSSAVLALNYMRHGCAAVVINFDPALALSAIEEWSVTCFLGYPTMMTYMLERGPEYDLTSMRNMQYGGGAFSDTTILALLDTFPCTFIQCYGTTESVGVTFLSQEDHERARDTEPGLLRSCGRPAFLTDVRLDLDSTAADEVEGRAVGELKVRSTSSMLGYWRAGGKIEPRPEWLSTGDLGFVDDRGYFFLVGRSKDVIISGGENIYATQVENVIASHPSVLESAVIGIPDEKWGESVKAVVVLRTGADPVDADELRDLVRNNLASYAKPSQVEFVAELPRTPTGKVLKRALLEDLD